MAITKVTRNMLNTGIVDNSNATAITIDSSENVGIGYASPNAKFVVGTASGQNIEFFPENATDTNLLQNYDRTASAYQKIETRAAEHILSIGSSEKMRINSSGNVGIGTTSPSDLLHVKGSGSANLLIDAATDNATLTLQAGSSDSGAEGAFAVFVQNTTNKWQLGMDTDNDFRLYNYAASSEALCVNPSGNVGIGLTTPSDNNTKCLYLKGNENVMSIRNLSTSNAGERVSIDFLDHNGTRRGYVSVDTSGTLFSTSSDYRLKNVIEPVQNGIERINKLKPVKFEWKETGKEEEGFIAHEVDEIFKDAVGGEKDAVHEDGSIDGQTMDYGRITPLLVKAIQELTTKLEAAEARITTLEG